MIELFYQEQPREHTNTAHALYAHTVIAVYKFTKRKKG